MGSVALHPLAAMVLVPPMNILKVSELVGDKCYFLNVYQ